MNLTRAVTLGVLGGAVAVWLAAAATTGAKPDSGAPPSAPGSSDARSEELSAETARLHERLRPTVAPLQTRDLFRYSRRSTVAPAVPTAPPDAALPLPAGPPLKLVGIAEDTGPQGMVRTVMLSVQGELVFAKEGDTISARYQVSRISPEVVELTDTAAGSLLRLALK